MLHDRKLAKSSTMAEFLTAKTLRSSILGFQILDGNTEVQEALESTESRLNILMMSEHPQRHKVPRTNTSIIGDRTPHLANSRDDETLSREGIKDFIRRSVHRETTEDRLGDIADHWIVSIKVQMVSRSRPKNGVIFVQRGSTDSDLGRTID